MTTPLIPPELIGKVLFQGSFKNALGETTLHAFIITEEGRAKNANFSVRPGESVVEEYEETKKRFEQA